MARTIEDLDRTERRPAIDVARILALCVVVCGHLLMAVVDRPERGVRSANLLALQPGLAWLAVLAPMPVFFAAGGWANTRATLATSAVRLRSLVGLSAVVVVVWSVFVAVVTALTGEAGVVGTGARLATQPLWFLAAYVPLAAYGQRLAGLASRMNMVVLAGAGLAGLALLDLARFAWGAPGWVGWPGFFLAWGLPWLAGSWWRQRYEATAGFRERRTGLGLMVGGAAACVGLVAVFGYSPALIDVVPGARSNTTPPTLYTGVAALAQVGALLLLAPALDRAGRRWDRIWSRAGEAAVGTYLFHLSGLASCIAAVAAVAGLGSGGAAGVALPERLTWGWWLSRPLWWAAVLAVTALCVALTAMARRSLAPGARSDRDSTASVASSGGVIPALLRRHAVHLGVVTATVAAAYVGLQGPRTIGPAAVCTALFAAAWWLLQPPRPSLIPGLDNCQGAP